ncbi:GHMP kinase [Pyrococcus furiosus DSM 3638]|uniref:Beta-ribofuranosylaminobenzene 5'-phosphate synthase n=3 Tax=Pyrococcus furiosus TaxID=2261 RepID=A0A5C0XPE6_PYRFU|nr:beta-ribofuranosylaminobenzene 5'-phosphate synthase family protein [Pyrococcus furiosus]AAL81027.1 hypothetical protein PF0903 [Pyrococcus furiosus DSM 3638]AFN03696.1 hypothetical protein PFC_03735 [Pyrococcus furiosus COM1]QEK78572.1 GHMP kinase [Pyrococcus furiosus DSM 3638]
MLVITPRRLHLGIIDPTGSLGRRFGSLGVALEGGYEIRITPADSLKIEAEKEDKETIKETIEKLNFEYDTGFGFYIEVRKSIPRHIGLGSTTQLTLGIAMGILKLLHKDVPVEEVAKILGRGKNSGVGIYAFKYGGFVVDGGVKDSVPPLLVRKDFPEDWAFLLVIPQVKRGFDEKEEQKIMEKPFGSASIAKEISYRILLGLLPALAEKNIEEFGRYLSTIQTLVGSSFSDFQGGEFREDIRLIVEFLNEITYGAGQSSWGPTVYGLIKRAEYQRVASRVAEFLDEQGIKAKIELGIPRNRGAEVKGESLFLERLIKSVSQ